MGGVKGERGQGEERMAGFLPPTWLLRLLQVLQWQG